MNLPRIFIGSSSESYEVASACNTCMDRKAEGTLWPNIFAPGGSTLNSLTEKASNVDFALFIFSPDDITKMRNSTVQSVRDNVLFELGLFIGSLGQERCFILKPRDVILHMPTDLLGLNTMDYNAERGDGDLDSAVNAACSKFIKVMGTLGRFDKKTKDFIKLGSKHKTYELTDDCHRMIASLVVSINNFDAISQFDLESMNDSLSPLRYNVSLMKLERAGIVDRINEGDINGNQWYGYKLTSDGIEFVLENEGMLDELMRPKQQRPLQRPQQNPKKYNEPPMDFDDEIPF
ncbi:TIR domain-containing protein [Aliivibrio kagoshimensis]|uniref:TIR domain-containing protein n=1 Tax=Aliivibrio kagoshimensis TaxID=2910230 RepID=UPI003D11E1B7